MHPAICGGTDQEKQQMSQYMKHLPDMINGSLIRKFSKDDMLTGLKLMMDKKVIDKVN